MTVMGGHIILLEGWRLWMVFI